MSTGFDHLISEDDSRVLDALELKSREVNPNDVYRSETVVSTTSGTKTVVFTGTNMFLKNDMDHPVQVGDLLDLSGTSGGLADGRFTIATVVDDTSVTIAETIADSTGGIGAFVYPQGSKSIGYNGLISGNNPYEALNNIKAFKTFTTDSIGDQDVVAETYDDSIEFKSSDDSVGIYGNNTAKTLNFIITGGGAASIISADIISSDTAVSTISNTYEDLPGMSFTVEVPGTYLTFFSSDIVNTQNKQVSIILYAGGTPIQHSERAPILSSNKIQVFHTQGLSSNLLLNDVIKLQWKTEGGTAISYNRSMVILRIRDEEEPPP